MAAWKPHVESSSLLPPQETARPSSSSRLLPIEGLRTCLTLTIVMFHYWCCFDTDNGFSEEREMLAEKHDAIDLKMLERGGFLFLKDSGTSGVTCFLVISGFVAQLADRPPPTSPREAARFLLNRMLRLAPVYYACMALVGAGHVLRKLILHESFCSSPIGLWSTLAELAMLQSWLPLRAVPQPNLYCPWSVVDQGGHALNFFEMAGVNVTDWWVQTSLRAHRRHPRPALELILQPSLDLHCALGLTPDLPWLDLTWQVRLRVVGLPVAAHATADAPSRPSHSPLLHTPLGARTPADYAGVRR